MAVRRRTGSRINAVNPLQILTLNPDHGGTSRGGGLPQGSTGTWLCARSCRITHIKKTLRKWAGTAMNARRMSRTAVFWCDEQFVNEGREFPRGWSGSTGACLMGVLELASGTGTCAVSLRELRGKHPGTPEHDRVTGLIMSEVRETLCSRPKKIAEVSKRSVMGRRRERLIREEIIGRGMRAGLGTGRR